jgi:hypothetical protein
MSYVTLSRKELYDLVWSEPMMRLARRYGISDVGLAKICRKCDIPRPPRGYWAKKQVGKAPRQNRLPHPEEELKIELRDPADCRIVSPELQNEVVQKISEEKQSELKIEVADHLRGSHSLVSQANQELQTAKTNENNLIILPEKAVLDIHVSKGCLRRSLLIMDALLKGLEQRGYQVSAGPTVEILGIAVRFGISEPLQTIREEADEADLNGSYSFMHSRFTRKLSPSGKLVLRIDGWADGCRQTWRDGGKHPLEDRLNSFVSGLIEHAARQKERQIERERKAQAEREAQQRRQEEAKRRAKKRALIKAERVRVDALIEKSTQWQQSQNLRRYIEAEKQKYLASHTAIELESEFSRWLEWAVRQADRLDPFVESPPSILDEVVPDEPEEPKSWWNR